MLHPPRNGVRGTAVSVPLGSAASLAALFMLIAVRHPVMVTPITPQASVQPLVPSAANDHTANAAAANTVSASRRIGFRSVAMDVSNITDVLQHHVYVVNGVRIFAKGANWVPPDSFEARATDTVLCQILANAKLANMNFLRIWGGVRHANGMYRLYAYPRKCRPLPPCMPYLSFYFFSLMLFRV